jgi:hypothetical protein
MQDGKEVRLASGRQIVNMGGRLKKLRTAYIGRRFNKPEAFNLGTGTPGGYARPSDINKNETQKLLEPRTRSDLRTHEDSSAN